MANNNQNNKINLLFLLAVANLLAAFGGGSVLQRALAEVSGERGSFPERFDEPLVALMIGTAIGLLLIVLMKKVRVKWLPKSRKVGSYFSFAGGLFSIALAVVFNLHKGHPQDKVDGHYYLFYALLSILFSLLFIPRVLRSDIAAGDKQKIGWVEFCYSTGMVLGLLAWTSLVDERAQPEFEMVLYYNVGFQVLAGILDFTSSHLTFADVARPSSSSNIQRPLAFNWDLYIKVTIAVIALTISIQVVTIEFRSAFKGLWQPNIILATFYFGAAIAALMFSMVKTKVELPHSSPKAVSGILAVDIFNKTRRIPFILLSLLTALPLLLVITLNWNRCPAQLPCSLKDTQDKLMFAVFVLFITLSAFLFEWIVLALFNFIGLKAKEKNREGLVAITFGSMGIGAAISIFCLKVAQGVLTNSLTRHLCWVLILMAGIIIANLAIGSTIRSVRFIPTLRFDFVKLIMNTFKVSTRRRANNYERR
ncbi:MAG TPA: hypothetical protein VF543_04525 [Pyrinomonadaceae bacterium]|jgi:hypothetical protein